MNKEMIFDPDAHVSVRRHFNDFRKATFKLSEMSGLHWTSVSGGVGVSAPRPFLHGYVYCTAMLEGELAHSCSHGPPPHRILVCVLKKDNPDLFPRLLAMCPRPNQPVASKSKKPRSA